MYDFILSMWTADKLSEAQVKRYAPMFITIKERDEILATTKQI